MGIEGQSTAGKLARWGRMLGGAALVSAALFSSTPATAADGNVTAYVDSSGDLWMIADELDNGVRVTSVIDDSDTFRIGGLGSTTVNGQPEVMLVAPGTRMILILGGGANQAWLGNDLEPYCCYRDLIVVGGSGDDSMLMIGGFLHVTAELGAGNDSIIATEDGGGIGGFLRLGDGDDVIELDYYTVLGGTIDMGAGTDQILGLGANNIGGFIELGTGNDLVQFTDIDCSSFELNAGPGDDRIEIMGWTREGSLTLGGGSGDDSVHIEGNQDSAEVIDSLSMLLGPDADRFALGSMSIRAALFDGGDGEDVYLDLGGTRFVAGPPEIRSFEVPKTSPGPTVEIQTTIIGRVIAENGAGVADATVMLPELGLITSTDGQGAFSFDPIMVEHQSLEITVGAMLRGRARSGAASVNLVPFGASNAGNIVLESGLENVLVFGQSTYHSSALEVNLQTLGLRPAEVTALESLPEDLSPYGVIWHIGGRLSPDDQQRLEAFVRSGRGLHLTGLGRPVNDSLQPLVNEIVVGGGIEVGISGNPSALHSFNPYAVGGVTNTPNLLTRLARVSYRRFVGGVESPNVLVSLDSGDILGAVWEPSDIAGGRGHLTLIMDDVWIQPDESLDVIENLQAFLQRRAKALLR